MLCPDEASVVGAEHKQVREGGITVEGQPEECCEDKRGRKKAGVDGEGRGGADQTLSFLLDSFCFLSYPYDKLSWRA